MMRAFFNLWNGFRRGLAHLLLALVYFCVVTPIALLLRLVGRPRPTGWVAYTPVKGQPSEGLVALLVFLRVRKRYWLLPVVLVLAVLSLLLVLSEGVALAPFIYTLF